MADKITIFKEVFDYYYDGEITKEQLADLLLMHYETRWGDGVDAKEIEDKDLRMIWRTLQHSVIKSTKNAKQYEKQQNKKSAFQEVKETEFDIPNCLSPSNDEEVEQPQPIGDNATESLKTAIEEEVQINNNIDNDMGTFIGDFKELNSKTTTLNVEEEFDNFSDTLNDLLDEYEGVIEQLTSMIAKANISGDVSIIADAKMAEMRIKNIAKELITEIDKTNYTNYINEKIEIKTKRLQVA